MTTTTAQAAVPAPELPPTRRGAPHLPIRTWAVVGTIFLALEAWVLGAWIITGQATPTPTGPTAVPTWMVITARSFEVGATTAWLALLITLVVRPRRRLGYIPPDGRLLLGMTIIFWLDPFLNYFQNTGTYNAVFFNLGSWVSQFPGSIAPRANLLVEPIFFVIPAYAVFVFAVAKLGTVVMKRAQARWPNIGRLQVVGLCLLTMILADFILEMSWVQLGYYTFAGTIHDVTLFAGHTYQFPLYESLFTGILFTAFACLRYFTDENGEMFVERGANALAVSERRRAQLKFVAMYGFQCSAFMLAYCLPMAIIGANADAWPTDTVKSSYLNDGMCGDGTPYHCPGPDVPLPRNGSAHIAPDGSMSGPAIAPEPAP